MAVAPTTRRILSVSDLAAAARFLLEERFALVWVGGEISNLRVPASGHWYFTLKDAKAQIRCAMFVSRNRLVRFRPKDGDQVVLRGRISLYEARGDFQLIGEHLEPAGAGALQAAFDELKAKLEAEGLFARDIKRPLPEFPRHVAIVSSRSGAALRDAIAVFRRRCPTLRVTLVPVAVQGSSAADEIVAALRQIDAWPDTLGDRPEAVLLCRGGGSLEDLIAFNTESVARAIRASRVPIVSAVGHETDVTIADFAADLRAPTPSAGAELLAPHLERWAHDMRRLSLGLRARAHAALSQRRNHLSHLERRLTHPGRAIQQRMQRLDDIERRLHRSWRAVRHRHEARLDLVRARLGRYEPRREVALALQRLHGLAHRLDQSVHRALTHGAESLTHATRALNAVSPLNTLGRGYAILSELPASGGERGTAITRAGTTAPGRRIVAQLADGRLLCVVEEVIVENP